MLRRIRLFMVGEVSEDGKWVWDGSEWQPVNISAASNSPSLTISGMPTVQDSVISGDVHYHINAVPNSTNREIKTEPILPPPIPPVNIIHPSKSISKEIKQRAFLRRCFVFLIILSGVLTAAQMMVSDNTGSWFLGAILGWIMLKLFPSKSPRGDAANFIESLLWKIV